MGKITTLAMTFIGSAFIVIGTASSSWTSNRAAEKHRLLSKALSAHVEEGLVDYERIGQDKNFNAYLDWLAEADTSKFATREEELAFWINAYNALAIKGVLDNWPLERVIDVSGFFSSQEHRIAGVRLTLDQVEKEIIFKKFREPRLHFVLVCAAVSCPNLPSVAYTGENVLERIEDVTRAFLNNPQKNRLDQETKTLYLSQIFNWYQSDFEGNGRSVIDFIKPYLSNEAVAFLAEPPVKIEYLEYDWTLNGQNR